MRRRPGRAPWSTGAAPETPVEPTPEEARAAYEAERDRAAAKVIGQRLDDARRPAWPVPHRGE